MLSSGCLGGPLSVSDHGLDNLFEETWAPSRELHLCIVLRPFTTSCPLYHDPEQAFPPLPCPLFDSVVLVRSHLRQCHSRPEQILHQRSHSRCWHVRLVSKSPAMPLISSISTFLVLMNTLPPAPSIAVLSQQYSLVVVATVLTSGVSMAHRRT